MYLSVDIDMHILLGTEYKLRDSICFKNSKILLSLHLNAQL